MNQNVLTVPHNINTTLFLKIFHDFVSITHVPLITFNKALELKRGISAQTARNRLSSNSYMDVGASLSN